VWHGAAWRFLVWGLFHGVLLVLERAGLAKGLRRLPGIVQHAYTLAAVMVGWVFFRADKLADGVRYLSAMAGLNERNSSTVGVAVYFTPDVTVALVVGAIGCVPVIPFLNRWMAASLNKLDHQFRPVLDGAIGAARLAAMSTLFVAASALSAAGTYNPFIYFRF